MTCDFASFSTVFQWSDDNEGLCAMEPRLRLGRFRLERGSNLGPLDQYASALPTELPGLLNNLEEFAIIVLRPIWSQF